MSLTRFLKKALPPGSAFLFFCSQMVLAACLPPAGRESVTVANVYDGDTVRLTDGRRVRLVGINTPETAKQDQPEEWLAEEASRRLQQLLSGGQISLSLGIEKHDSYGRWLGHLWRNDKLLTEQLMQEGLGYQISIPPNLALRGCLHQAEQRARQQGLGLWQKPPREVTSLHDREQGFRILQGQVSAVKRINSGWLLELDDRLAVKLNFTVVAAIGEQELGRLLQKKITVRGWIRPKQANAPAHYQPWFMSLSHQDHLEY